MVPSSRPKMRDVTLRVSGIRGGLNVRPNKADDDTVKSKKSCLTRNPPLVRACGLPTPAQALVRQVFQPYVAHR